MVTRILHCLAWRPIRPHLIALLITLLMISSFFTMMGHAHAASAPQYPGHPVSLGSTGPSVKLIEAALNLQGAHLAVDGIFGPLTRAAVIDFQRAHGLEADGIVSPLTWGALFNTDVPGSSSPTAGYINPIQPGLWAPARTDQGVDWLPLQPNTPVLAIGDGVVTFSSLHSYWVGGGNITYQLTKGPKAGLYIYVTEHLTSVLPVGSVVTPGEAIATAQPGFPWTEWGWAAPQGTGSYAPAVPYSGTPDGNPTAGGLAMARFFRELGATTLQDPGPGPDTPFTDRSYVQPKSYYSGTASGYADGAVTFTLKSEDQQGNLSMQTTFQQLAAPQKTDTYSCDGSATMDRHINLECSSVADQSYLLTIQGYVYPDGHMEGTERATNTNDSSYDHLYSWKAY